MDSLAGILPVLPILKVEPGDHRPEWPWYIETQEYRSDTRVAFCHVCHQECIFENVLSTHLTSDKHLDNVKLFNSRLDKSLTVLQRFNGLNSSAMKETMERLEALPSPVWKNDILSVNSLLQYLTCNDTNDTNGANDTTLTIQGKFVKEKMKSIVRHEYMERIALLKLAVWKAECKKQMPASALLDLFAADQWFTSGWKYAKAATKRTSAIDIVATAVAPFLERPHERYDMVYPSIQVKTGTGQVFPVWVGPHDTIHDAMVQVQRWTGFSPSRHRLIYEGRSLESDQTWESYNMAENATIDMVLRMGGPQSMCHSH